ncbi:2Fe-2S iron-sulfur cluster-binding protein [Geopseudomonas sagittaria]|uniref:2Fe-2S iron-sulfur cluster-binding protein n=1 Tax=Geopseudomonas sagittaria TaxID=1135990 RepID=UPI001FE6BFE1|nr:2Fe-2S iron-sulfur cluster-binding protein [Pseudomonas sagittaria]
MEIQGKCCVLVGCRGGGCELCLVLVVRGEFDCGRMSSRHAPPTHHLRHTHRSGCWPANFIHVVTWS